MKQKPKQQSELRRIVLFAIVLVAIAAVILYVMLPAHSSVAGTALPVIGADGYQEVHMAVNGLDYEPSTILVRSGQKVRWTIDASRAQGCAHSMLSTPLGVNRMLNFGITVIEFTPTKTGTIPFSCAMGMARGQFQVV